MRINKQYKYSSIAILLLLCLILLTLKHINDAKSKYKADANGASNSSIAQWSVALDSVTEGNSFNIIAGNTSIDYSVKVESASEVSCSYSIIVSNVPNDVRVSLDDGDTKTPSSNVVTFDNSGSFIIGNGITERIHKLSFSAPIESNTNNNQINIQVLFTQIN